MPLMRRPELSFLSCLIIHVLLIMDGASAENTPISIVGVLRFVVRTCMMSILLRVIIRMHPRTRRWMDRSDIFILSAQDGEDAARQAYPAVYIPLFTHDFLELGSSDESSTTSTDCSMRRRRALIRWHHRST